MTSDRSELAIHPLRKSLIFIKEFRKNFQNFPYLFGSSAKFAGKQGSSVRRGRNQCDS